MKCEQFGISFNHCSSTEGDTQTISHNYSESESRTTTLGSEAFPFPLPSFFFIEPVFTNVTFIEEGPAFEALPLAVVPEVAEHEAVDTVLRKVLGPAALVAEGFDDEAAPSPPPPGAGPLPPPPLIWLARLVSETRPGMRAQDPSTVLVRTDTSASECRRRDTVSLPRENALSASVDVAVEVLVHIGLEPDGEVETYQAPTGSRARNAQGEPRKG